MHPKDAYHEPKAHITMLCIISRLRRSHFIVCVCKPWLVRHILHANLFAIHDTECQFIHPKDEIHDAKHQFILHFYGGRVVTDKTTPPRRGDPYVVARSHTVEPFLINPYKK